MRARWLATGVLLAALVVSVPVVFGQGGPGVFLSSSCSSLANPVSGATVCWQTSAPNAWFYWDGSQFTVSGGPFPAGGVLYGNGTGAVLSTAAGVPSSVLAFVGGVPVFSTAISLSALVTSGQFGIGLEPFGTDPGSTGGIYFRELSGTDYVLFQAPDALAAPITFRWPATTGTNGFALITDGGNPATLSWASIGGGGGTGLTSLNSLTATTQTFANDTNLQIVSATSTHTLTWAGTLAVARGGLGVGTLASNGVLVGNGTGAVVVTAAGAADTVLRVPGAGGTPAFGALDVSKAAAITGLVRTANLGTGTADATSFLRGDQTYAPIAAPAPAVNYGFNTNYEIWGSGTTSAPTSWTASSCSTVAKETTAGLFKFGAASVALTRTSGTCLLSQDIVVAWPPVARWQSQMVVLGGWVRCTVAARGFLELNDGTTTTTSTAHTGGSAFEFLTVTASLGSGASKFEVRAKVAGGSTTCQFDGLIATLGSAVTAWQPDAWNKGTTILVVGSGTNVVAVGFYGNQTAGSIEGNQQVRVPFKGVARNLYAISSSSTTATDTFRVAGVNTALAATFGSATTAADTTHEVEIAAGAKISMGTNEGDVFSHNSLIEYERIP